MRYLLFFAFIGIAFAFVNLQPDPIEDPTIYASTQDWAVYGGTSASTRYSALEGIHTGNVKNLAVAWEYHTGDLDTNNRGQIQCNPLIINGVLFGASSKVSAFALDAATGKEKWKFNPFTYYGGQNSWAGTSRGMAYWSEGSDQRILFSGGSYLICLDAATGKPVPSFGDNGRIDLRKDLDHSTEDFFIVSNTPGIIYKDLIIMGCRLSEGLDAAPGHVRAYNVRTGKRAWIFHTIPHPGEPGYETWKDPAAWQRIGGANCWAGMSVDEKRGTVFVGTGSSTYDFWGGYRLGDNLYSNCILALDATTGQRKWHYQTVHHDLWDKDLPAPPTLVKITRKGKTIEAVAQITKHGFIFVLDRDTGKPLFKVKEQKVPASDLEGEKTAKTQPYPTLPVPFMRQQFDEADVNDITPEIKAEILEQFRALRSENTLFGPPSEQGSVLFPGFDGGGEWGGAAFDPTSNWLYVNANEMPWTVKMVKNEAKQSVGQALYIANCANCHGLDRKGNRLLFPSLIGIEKKYTVATLDTFLRNGKGRMPAFGYWPAADRTEVANYLLGLASSADQKEAGGERAVLLPTYTMTGYNRFLTKEGYPAIKPPWGTLNAIDLNTGQIAWKVPLGEFDELTKAGIPVTGTENYGGPVVTAGGLVFIGATKDERFRAFDKKTGQLLFETKLPAGGYATPATFSVNGKQYVVIACGGGKMGTKSGDSYLCFALP